MWGFKNRLTKIGEGQFQCPVCHVHGSYTVSKLRRWFTLFWIPLIPGKVRAHVVTCGTCASTFPETVLDMAAARVGDDALTAVGKEFAAPTTVPWAPPSGPPGYSNN